MTKEQQPQQSRTEAEKFFQRLQKQRPSGSNFTETREDIVGSEIRELMDLYKQVLQRDHPDLDDEELEQRAQNFYDEQTRMDLEQDAQMRCEFRTHYENMLKMPEILKEMKAFKKRLLG